MGMQVYQKDGYESLRLFADAGIYTTQTLFFRLFSCFIVPTQYAYVRACVCVWYFFTIKKNARSKEKNNNTNLFQNTENFTFAAQFNIVLHPIQIKG